MKIVRITSENFVQWRNQISEIITDSAKINFPNSIITDDYGKLKCDDISVYLKDGSAVIFVAAENEELKGWVWCHRIVRLSTSRLHIAEIAISRNCRNHGIGSMLLGVVETHAKKIGLTEIDLLVTASNAEALSFYDKAGFLTERLQLKKTIGFE